MVAGNHSSIAFDHTIDRVVEFVIERTNLLRLLSPFFAVDRSLVESLHTLERWEFACQDKAVTSLMVRWVEDAV